MTIVHNNDNPVSERVREKFMEHGIQEGSPGQSFHMCLHQLPSRRRSILVWSTHLVPPEMWTSGGGCGREVVLSVWNVLGGGTVVLERVCLRRLPFFLTVGVPVARKKADSDVL